MNTIEKNIEYLKEDYIEKNKDFKFKVSPAKANVEDILIEHYEKKYNYNSKDYIFHVFFLRYPKNNLIIRDEFASFIIININNEYYIDEVLLKQDYDKEIISEYCKELLNIISSDNLEFILENIVKKSQNA